MKCQYCSEESKTDPCSKCKADFDSSVKWFQEEMVRGYYAK
jgi:hypothetical protein